KAGRSQDQACEPVIPMEQLAEILSRPLCYSVDIFGYRSNILGYPRRRSFGRRRESATECAGCTGEDKRADACRHAFFEEIECAGDISVNEALTAVGNDVRFVKRRGMEDCVHTLHTLLNVVPINYRPNLVREV